MRSGTRCVRCFAGILRFSPFPHLSCRATQVQTIWRRTNHFFCVSSSTNLTQCQLRLLEIRQTRQGPEHPSLLFTLRKLAKLYQARGKCHHRNMTH
jgi:hypothetical protein